MILGKVFLILIKKFWDVIRIMLKRQIKSGFKAVWEMSYTIFLVQGTNFGI